MSIDKPTPGYKWAKVKQEHLYAPEVPSIDELGAVDLREPYPLPDPSIIQGIWDSRRQAVAEPQSRTSSLQVPYTVFNPSAQQTIASFPGWGMTCDRPNGGRSAVMVAAYNPGYRVIVPDEAQGVSADVRRDARMGFLSSYALIYRHIFDCEGMPTVLAGSSRGGTIALYLAQSGEVPVKIMCLQETPVSPYPRGALRFAVAVGVRDNIASGQQRPETLRDLAEEAIIAGLEIHPGRRNRGPVHMLGLYARQSWLVHGLGRVPSDLTSQAVQDVFASNPEARLFWSHGRGNIGIPVETVRRVIREIRADPAGLAAHRLGYFESETGHYAIGHTSRSGRLIRYKIAQTALDG